MTLVKSIVGWININRKRQIEQFKKHPFDVQHDTLMKLLKKAAKTEWGKRYNYSSIRSIKEFQDRVPLQHYEDIKPFIDRIRQGEQNVLWPTEIRWFAKSAGTTADKSKFIPVSREALEECHFRAGKDLFALYTENYPDTRIYNGKVLTIGGSHKINNFRNQSYYGDLSAIYMQNFPFWMQLIRTPDKQIALMEDWEAKMEAILKTSIHENVVSMAGVPSWTLVLLEYILKNTGKSNILEIWPNIELFAHGGVSFKPYRRQYEILIPTPRMRYVETYNASEGFFSIQDDPASDDMLLMLDYGILYEFIPFELLEKGNPPVYHIGNVETGKNYVMVISTNGGLWRYIIGDTVTFTSTFPHKIKITGRTKNYINVFGEELIIDNAERAVLMACQASEAIIRDYTAAPVFMTHDRKGAHEWVIEFEKAPPDINHFTELLDNALQSVNSDYEAKRHKNITLDKPLIHSVKQGVFYTWFQVNNKLGGQNKIPRLSNSRKYVEELLEIHKRK